MSTPWICVCLIAFALGYASYSLARRGWKKAVKFAKGPPPIPKGLRAPMPLKRQRARRTPDRMEIKSVDDINLLCQKIEEGWRP